MGETKPGTTVPVKILRDGSTKTLEAIVLQLPGCEQLAQNNNSNSSDNGTLNGVTGGDLDQQTRQELKVPENVKRVVITEVQPDSPAAEAALKQGDVIQAHGGPTREPIGALPITAGLMLQPCLGVSSGC